MIVVAAFFDCMCVWGGGGGAAFLSGGVCV